MDPYGWAFHTFTKSELNDEVFSNNNSLNQEKEDIKYKQMEQLMEKKMQEMNDKVEKEIEEIKKEYTEIKKENTEMKKDIEEIK